MPSNPAYNKTAYRKLREKILVRDNYTCYYCGLPGKSIDHLIPLSKGGIDHEDNMVVACTSCNSSKRDRMTPGSFLSAPGRPSTPTGNFLPENGETKRHYA